MLKSRRFSRQRSIFVSPSWVCNRRKFAPVLLALVVLGACGSPDRPGAVRTRVSAGAAETASTTGSLDSGVVARFRDALGARPILATIDVDPFELSMLEANGAYLVVGTIDGPGPEQIWTGPKMFFQCEEREGVPTGGQCSSSLHIQSTTVYVTVETTRRIGAPDLANDVPVGRQGLGLATGSANGEPDRRSARESIVEINEALPRGARFVALVRKSEVSDIELAHVSMWALVGSDGSLATLAIEQHDKDGSILGARTLDELLATVK